MLLLFPKVTLCDSLGPLTMLLVPQDTLFSHSSLQGLAFAVAASTRTSVSRCSWLWLGSEAIFGADVDTAADAHTVHHTHAGFVPASDLYLLPPAALSSFLFYSPSLFFLPPEDKSNSQVKFTGILAPATFPTTLFSPVIIFSAPPRPLLLILF